MYTVQDITATIKATTNDKSFAQYMKKHGLKINLSKINQLIFNEFHNQFLFLVFKKKNIYM